VLDLDGLVLDLACLLFDAQAHLRERGLHGRWQPLLVDVGHVAQTNMHGIVQHTPRSHHRRKHRCQHHGGHEVTHR
jgi:hypothetical protein